MVMFRYLIPTYPLKNGIILNMENTITYENICILVLNNPILLGKIGILALK